MTSSTRSWRATRGPRALLPVPLACVLGTEYHTDDTDEIYKIRVRSDTGQQEWQLLGSGTVPLARTIATLAPLTGGGDLSADRTLSLSYGASLTMAAGALAVVYGTGANTALEGSRDALYAKLAANNVLSGDNRFDQNVTSPPAPLDPAHLTNKAYVDGLAGTLGQLRQTQFVELAVDTSTTSMVFVPLMSQVIVKIGGTRLFVLLTTSFSNSGANRTVDFDVRVDGVTVRATSATISSANATGSCALAVVIPGLAAGARTVSVLWRTSGGTGSIRPVTAPSSEHASLFVQELV